MQQIGTLAPGMHELQRLAQGVPLLRRAVPILSDLDQAPVQMQGPRRGRRHLRYRLAPTLQVAVRPLFEHLVQLCGQQIRPTRHAIVRQQGRGTSDVYHARASMETKLKHWNHGTASVKPTPCRRCRWVASVSGSSTLSSAVRFWLISRSL